MRGHHADSKIHIFNVKLPHYMENGKCFIKVMKLQYCGKTMVKTDNNNHLKLCIITFVVISAKIR